MAGTDSSVFCSFCNEEFPSSKAMGDHLMMCGNKTDECPNCSKFIRRAVFAYHYENGCANLDAPASDDTAQQKPKSSNGVLVTIRCEHCKQNYDKNDRKAHQENCLRNPKNIANKQGSGRSNEFDDNALIPCEYCQKGISWDIYETHIKACQDQEYERMQSRARRTSRDTSNATTVGTPTATINATAPCRWCGRSMSSNGLSYHQLYCTKNPGRNKN